jgi:hypothetical protein
MKNCVAIPAGNGWTKLDEFPTATPQTRTRYLFEVGFCNAAAADVKVGLCITKDGAVPPAGDTTPASANCGVYEFQRVLGAAGVKGNGPLTRSVTLRPGQAIYVQASAVGVSATIGGMEV